MKLASRAPVDAIVRRRGFGGKALNCVGDPVGRLSVSRQSPTISVEGNTSTPLWTRLGNA
jgi:hypothetical protein